MVFYDLCVIIKGQYHEKRKPGRPRTGQGPTAIRKLLREAGKLSGGAVVRDRICRNNHKVVGNVADIKAGRASLPGVFPGGRKVLADAVLSGKSVPGLTIALLKTAAAISLLKAGRVKNWCSKMKNAHPGPGCCGNSGMPPNGRH